MSRFLIIAALVNLFLILATLLAYLSPLVNPESFWPVSIIGLVFPWLLLMNFLFSLFWAFQSKWWYALISLSVILAGWNQVQSIVGFNVPKVIQPDKPYLRMSTFNCHGLKDRNRKNEFISPEKLIELFRKDDPDVLCFQEFYPHFKQRKTYISFLTKNSELKYFFWEEDRRLAIFSRFPIVDKASRYFANRTNGFQYVDLNVDSNLIRVFNVHLQSNAVSDLAESVAQKGDLREQQTWRKIKSMLSLYRKAARMRSEQAKEIAGEIAKSPYPVILAGDFNDVPQSFAYQILSDGMKDTFKEEGWGLGWTFTGNIPGLRIDYVLVDPMFQTYDCQTEKIDFSDHRQIKSTILIR